VRRFAADRAGWASVDGADDAAAATDDVLIARTSSSASANNGDLPCRKLADERARLLKIFVREVKAHGRRGAGLLAPRSIFQAVLNN
jgi:hypothetical protein